MTELISHLNFLKKQLDFEIQDEMRWMIFLEAYHDYLKKALSLKNQLGITHLELKEALRNIEEVKIVPPGIMMKKTFKATNIDLGPS